MPKNPCLSKRGNQVEIGKYGAVFTFQLDRNGNLEELSRSIPGRLGPGEEARLKFLAGGILRGRKRVSASAAKPVGAPKETAALPNQLPLPGLSGSLSEKGTSP